MLLVLCLFTFVKQYLSLPWLVFSARKISPTFCISSINVSMSFGNNISAPVIITHIYSYRRQYNEAINPQSAHFFRPCDIFSQFNFSLAVTNFITGQDLALQMSHKCLIGRHYFQNWLRAKI